MCKKNFLALVPCSGTKLEGVPEVIRLVPLGRVRSQKGDFMVDEESYREMCKWMTSRGIDVVIDYEHQTLHDVQAPAAGWIKELTLADDAICGRVEWTPRAAEYLKNGEYRYLSPVVQVRQSDLKALRLPSVGLTNVPAIDGMIPIINSLDFEEGVENMNELLKQLAALLGLPEEASEADVAGAVERLLDDVKTLKAAPKPDEAVANKTILSLLSLKEDAGTADVAAEIARLQNQCGQNAQKLAEQESAGLVEQALKDGKITPAQKEWAIQYALSSKEGFSQFLAKASPVIPLGSLGISEKPGKRREQNEFDAIVCKNMGLTPEELSKYGKDEA